MTSTEEKKDIPSKYRLVCVSDGIPCGNCYRYGAPCLNCAIYENDLPTKTINWEEFQEISLTARHKTYNEFCKETDEIQTNNRKISTTYDKPVNIYYEDTYQCAGPYNESMSRCFCSYCN